EILRVLPKRGRLPVERVAALDRGSEFERGSLLRSRFDGLLGRPAVAPVAHREVIPEILRFVHLEQLHEVTSKQPARKQLVCSAERIRAEQQHGTSTCT